MMRGILASLLLVALLFAAAVVVYFSIDRSPSVFKMSASYPGASAQVVQDTVTAPLVQQLDGCEGMEKLEAVSTPGRSEIYIVCRGGIDAAILTDLLSRRESLAAPVLPTAARLDKPELLPRGTALPVVRPKLIEENFVDIDRARLARMGFSLDDFRRQLGDIPPAKFKGDAKDLAAVLIKLPGGKTIPLGQLASIEMKRVPDAIVQTIP
jgi:Cu/Ag efflux pump CusA